MLFVVLSEAVQRGELFLVDGGLCHWHQCRDGSITIRDILVLPDRQRQGIGTTLLARLEAKHPTHLTARCPTHYPSNTWWSHQGFVLSHTLKGGTLNVWVKQIATEGMDGGGS